jgi:DDE superfamily endonuclease
VDETTLTLDPPLRACWMKIGQQKRIPATRPGIKQKRHVFGGYDWANDTITWTIAETKNSSQFIHFLEHLLVNVHPTGRVALVMDNAAYHKSAPSLAALSLFEHRVLVIWLPTYCSELNPIERYWRHLKDLACANKLQDNIDEVIRAAEHTLMDQNTLESASRYHVSKNL